MLREKSPRGPGIKAFYKFQNNKKMISGSKNIDVRYLEGPQMIPGSKKKAAFIKKHINSLFRHKRVFGAWKELDWSFWLSSYHVCSSSGMLIYGQTRSLILDPWSLTLILDPWYTFGNLFLKRYFRKYISRKNESSGMAVPRVLFVSMFSVFINLFDLAFVEFLFVWSFFDIMAIFFGRNLWIRLNIRAGESLCT